MTDISKLTAGAGARLFVRSAYLFSDMGVTLRSISDVINDSIREISDVLLGPTAPPRRRPRRVAKRIAARHGRLRFSRFNAGCKV